MAGLFLYRCLLLSFFLILASNNEAQPLLPFQQNGKFGLMNSMGEVVLPARYMETKRSLTGWAPVRDSTGFFAYADQRGIIRLPFRYAQAAPFEKGLAAVVLNGERVWIDTTGNVQIGYPYKQVQLVKKGLAVVEVSDGLVGLFDWVNKRLLIDTVWETINVYLPGIFIVDRYFQESDSRVVRGYNLRGELVLHHGAGNVIALTDTSFIVDPYSARQIEERYVVMSLQGKILHRFPDKCFVPDQNVVDSHFVVHFSPTKAQIASSRRRPRFDSYASVWKVGKRLATNPIQSFDEVILLGKGLIFARKTGEKYGLICDLNGKPQSQLRIKEVLDKNLQLQLLLVRVGDSVLAINTSGQRMGFAKTNGGNVKLVNRFVQTMDEVGDRFRYSLFESNGKLIHQARPQDFGFIDIGNVVSLIGERGNEQYFFRGTKMLAAENYLDTAARPLNVSEQQFAAYKVMGDWSYLQAFNKRPRAMIGAPAHFLNDHVDSPIQIHVNDGQKAVSNGQLVHQITVINTGKDTCLLPSQDHELFIVMQVKDSLGKWVNLERTAYSFCGSSYYNVYLPPGEKWNMTVPIYEGVFETKGRLKLLIKGSSSREPAQYAYSNEWSVQVNPGQLIQETSTMNIAVMSF